jgi:mRNA interferase HigB
MRILNLPLLEQYKQDHADVRGQLDAWRDEVGRDTWQTPQDIKRRYKSADFLSGNRVIFNIKGNSYRLAVQVRYRNGLVVIEWIGTHAEYSKKKF